MLARVEAERQRSAEREGRILAPVIIKRRVAHLDGAVGNGVEHLQARHDLTGGEGLNLKLVVGGFGDVLGKGFA